MGGIKPISTSWQERLFRPSIAAYQGRDDGYRLDGRAMRKAFSKEMSIYEDAVDRFVKVPLNPEPV